MYTEIIKIIEGGLTNDKEKVVNYATVLANNLEKQGESSLAKRILSTLSKKKGTLTSLDSLSTRPVDSESRMDIVEVSFPQIAADKLVLSKYTREKILRFIESYTRRDLLLQSGLYASNTLLLYGPPGCGKTTVAQLISSITGLPLVTARLDGRRSGSALEAMWRTASRAARVRYCGVRMPATTSSPCALIRNSP